MSDLQAALDAVFPPELDPANDEPVTIEGRDVWRLRHALAASATDEVDAHRKASRETLARQRAAVPEALDVEPMTGAVAGGLLEFDARSGEYTLTERFGSEFGATHLLYRFARPAVPEALDVEAIALKAAEIGFTYGALGRDYTFAYKNVQDMLAELKEGTSEPEYPTPI